MPDLRIRDLPVQATLPATATFAIDDPTFANARRITGAFLDGRYLLASNNLSDVDNVATARTSLGLGTGDSPTFTALTLTGAGGLNVTAGDIYIERGGELNFPVSGVERAGVAATNSSPFNELQFFTGVHVEAVRIDAFSNLGVGITSSLLARVHIDTVSTVFGKPVAYFDQADIDQPFFQFATTIGIGNAIEAVGAKTLTVTHFLMVEIPGGLIRYAQLGTI